MNVQEKKIQDPAVDSIRETGAKQKIPERETAKVQSDLFDDVPLRTILSSHSRTLSSRIPFPFEKKQEGEELLACTIGSLPLEDHVRMYAELSSKEIYLGSLYRKDGEVVFEPGQIGANERLLFSRESFHEAITHAAKELENHKDYVFIESSPEPE